MKSALSPLLERVEQVQLLGVAFVVEVDRIVAGEAGVAEALALAVEVNIHAVAAQVGECVGLEVAADFFHGAVLSLYSSFQRFRPMSQRARA